jgi:hypothetical protein
MKINLKYLIAFLVLLIIEIIIGLFVNDAIIRPYIGDVLVVILIYTFIRGIVHKSIKFLPVYLFVFAFAVELAQYYRVVYLLHLQDNKVISTIIGTSYDIKDILCYLIAAVVLVIWESLEKCSNKNSPSSSL